MDENEEIEIPDTVQPVEDSPLNERKEPDVDIAIEGLNSLEELITNDDFDGVLLCLIDIHYNLRLNSDLPVEFGSNYDYIGLLLSFVSIDDLCTQFMALSIIGKLIQLSPNCFSQFMDNEGIDQILPFIYRKEISYFKPSISIVIALTMREECHDVMVTSQLLPNTINKINENFGKLDAKIAGQSSSVLLLRQRISLLLKVAYNLISIMNLGDLDPWLADTFSLFIEIINSPFGYDYFPIACDSIRMMIFKDNIEYMVNRINECFDEMTACFQKALNLSKINDMCIYMRTVIQLLNLSNQRVPNEFLDALPIRLADEIIHSVSSKSKNKSLEMSIVISFLEAALLSNEGYLLNQYFNEEVILSLTFAFNESPGSSKDYALNFLWSLAKLLPPDGLKMLFESPLFEPMLTIFDGDDESFFNQSVQQTIVAVLNRYKQIDDNTSSGTWCSIRTSLENGTESEEIGYPCDLINKLVFGTEEME